MIMQGGDKMDITQTAFMLILNAGNARSNAVEAEKYASEYNFDKALELIKKAKEDLNSAHQIQTDLIQAEARGEQQQFGLIMVHAQDHLTMAMLAIDHAKSIMQVYQKLYQYEKER